MNQPVSLFDDPASAGGDAQPSPGGWAAVRARMDSDGIALTPPLLSEASAGRPAPGSATRDGSAARW